MSFPASAAARQIFLRMLEPRYHRDRERYVELEKLLHELVVEESEVVDADGDDARGALGGPGPMLALGASLDDAPVRERAPRADLHRDDRAVLPLAAGAHPPADSADGFRDRGVDLDERGVRGRLGADDRRGGLRSGLIVALDPQVFSHDAVTPERLHDPLLDVALDVRVPAVDPGVEEKDPSALRPEIAIDPERGDENEAENDREHLEARRAVRFLLYHTHTIGGRPGQSQGWPYV